MLDYDPLGPVADPATTYRELRDTCPVHRFDQWTPPFYTVSRHADVQRVLRDPRAWSSEFGQDAWFKEEPGFRNDPPEHTRYRRILNRVLSAQVVVPRADEIRTAAHRLVDGLPSRRGDLLDDVTAVLPAEVFAPVLGIAVADHPALWGCTFDVLASPESGATDQLVTWDGQRSKQSWQAARDHLGPILEARRAGHGRGPDSPDTSGAPLDLLTAMVEARDTDGAPLSDDALVHAVMLVYFGAVHTTTMLLTNALVRLLERRERWEALCADRTLAAAIVEESARFDPPVPGIFRTTTDAVAMRGTTIPAGAKVRALFAAANRDPDVFSDADTFRIDRDSGYLARRHFGFGYGIHLCAGAPLARLESQIALEVLAERLPGLRLLEPERWWEEGPTLDLRSAAGVVPAIW